MMSKPLDTWAKIRAGADNDLSLSAAAPRDFSPVYVRFGSKANIAPRLDFVRFTPKSGHACGFARKAGVAPKMIRFGPNEP
jgi:hypothetical protein